MSMGYPVYGPRAIRADLVERVHRTLSEAARKGPFEMPPRVGDWLGSSNGVLGEIIEAFGYREREDGRFESRWRTRSRRRRRRRPAGRSREP
jgi:ATP-dependent RNA helicase SUPV3L1/SUV3